MCKINKEVPTVYVFGNVMFNLFMQADYDKSIKKVSIYFDDTFILSFNPHCPVISACSLIEKENAAVIADVSLDKDTKEFVVKIKSSKDENQRCLNNITARAVYTIFKSYQGSLVVSTDTEDSPRLLEFCEMNKKVDFITIFENQVFVNFY